MKVWTKVRLKDYNKKVYYISRSLTNYLYKYGPILDIERKYNISDDEIDRVIYEIEANISGIITPNIEVERAKTTVFVSIL